MVDIPSNLVKLIKQGQVVLVLGAGASFGAESPDGSKAPSGRELARTLSEEFLDGKYQDRQLSVIAELATSQSDPASVQDFIANKLRPLKPTSFHKLIPTFRWHGIATTNYDLIIETSYKETDERIQKVAPFLSDEERVEDITRSPDHVLLIKLHGCISRIHDPNLPLILTPEQYITHRKRRHFLFELFAQWGKEKTLLFVGQDLYDSDLRQLMRVVEDRVGDFRPRYFLVRPEMGQEEVSLWARRKIDAIDATFEDFIVSLDKDVPKQGRQLLRLLRSEHPITKHIPSDQKISESLHDALSSDIEYVHSGAAIQSGSPQNFYRGFDLGWYPIINGLDVRRGLVDKLLIDIVVAEESDRPSKVELYVIKAEAGAGKSVLLRRLAWDASEEADVVAIYCHKVTNWAPIQELLILTKERLFLFVDDAADNLAGLDQLLNEAQREKLPLTVFTTESFSLWEIYCSRLNDHLTEDFELRRLNEAEIETLVDLLEQNSSLGVRLERMERSERIREFTDIADRQLLVALHEATQGVPLEAIVEEEYRKLRPRAAQKLYLTVCVLNRLRVSVRAGLISRVHGIPFDRFSEELLGPLDHVVRARKDPITKDYMYNARHPYIADLVFRRILQDPEVRYKEYSSIINALNIIYRTDEVAFEGLLKGKSVIDLFPDYEMASQLYDLAEQIAPHHGELFHQRAIFEIKRENPSTEKAYRALEKAWSLGRDSASITHTYAELALVQAENTASAIKREKYWEKTEELAGSILRHERTGQYARHTLVKLGIAKLKHALNHNEEGHLVEDFVADVEGHLERGYQQNPDDTYLRSSEADLRNLLDQSDEAIAALEAGFKSNPRDVFVAIRLAKAYDANGRVAEALETVDKALQVDRTNQTLNYRRALLMRKSGEADPSLFTYYFRRAFTPNDSNYDAQFWCARYLHELGDEESRAKSKELFRTLRSARIPYRTKVAIRDQIGANSAKLLHGTIRRLDSTYGHIGLDGDPDWIFMHEEYVDDDVWGQLSVGTRVTCQVGFQMRGPIAIHVAIE